MPLKERTGSFAPCWGNEALYSQVTERFLQEVNTINIGTNNTHEIHNKTSK